MTTGERIQDFLFGLDIGVNPSSPTKISISEINEDLRNLFTRSYREGTISLKVFREYSNGLEDHMDLVSLASKQTPHSTTG